MTRADLLRLLGRMLRGWANYFRHGVSKATFNAVDSYAWERIASWLRTQTPDRLASNCGAGSAAPAWRLAHRRGHLPRRRQRRRDPVPLPRLPHPDPVDPKPSRPG